MVALRNVSNVGSPTNGAVSGRLGRGGSSLVALLLASAAITTAAPVAAITLDLMGADTTLNGIAGSGTITNSAGGNATLTSNVAAGTFNFTGVISDSAGNLLKFRKTGAGTQRLDGNNTYQGGTEIVAGVLRFGAGDSLGTGAVEFTGAGVLRAVPVGLTLANDIVLTANGTIDGNTTILTGAISGAGSLTTLGNLQIDNAGNSYLGGTLLGGDLRLGGNNVLGGGAVTVTASGRLNAVTTAALNNAVVLNADLKVDLAGSALTLNGVVSGGAGNRLTVRDGATLNLTAANTYLGNTYVTSSVTDTSVLGIGNSLAVAGGLGTLIATSVDPAHPAVVRALGSYTLPVGNTVRVNGTLAVDTNGYGFGIAGKINNFNNATPGGLTVTGGGTLTLSGTGNNYSLGTTVQGNATLAVDADNLLGAVGTTVHLDTGALKVTGTSYTSTSRTIDVGSNYGLLNIDDASLTFTPSLIQGSGGFYKQGAGTLALTGANTQGFTYLQGGVMTIDAAPAIGSGAFYISGGALKPLVDVNLGNTFVFIGGAIDTNGHTVELSGAAVNGGFTKTGGGTLVLSGNDSFFGNLTVATGELRLSGTGSIGDGTGSATFGANSILSSLNSRTIANNLTLNGTVTIDDTNHAVTLSGVIGGAGGIVKPGAGTLTLTGVNTFTGTLDVNAGTVLVNGSNLNSSATNVASGATLGGSGSIGGTVTVNNGGHLAPGNSPGTMNVVDLALNSGSFLDFDLANPAVIGAGVNDLIIASGNVTLDGTLNVTALPGFTPGTYRLINYGGALTDNGLAIGIVPAGYMASDFTVSLAAGQVNLMVGLVVPGTLYWDGNGTPNNGDIAGGSGTWNAANTNWTNSTGTFNYAWNSQTGVFQTVGGTVTVVGTQAFDKLSFLVDGYSLTGGTLAGSAVAEVEVDGAATTTINSVISGASGLTKSGTGTLILGGSNTFNGLDIEGGTVTAASANAFGVGTLNFADGTTLRASGNRTITNGIVLGGGVTVDSAGSTLNLQGVISGSGPLTIYEPTSPVYGLTTLAAGNTYTGGTVVNFARLEIDADSALGVAGSGLTLTNAARLRTTASFTTSRDVTLNATTGFEPASGTTLTLGGIVSGARLGGRGAGTGTLLLANAANSFSGLDIYTGVVAINSDGAAGAGNIRFVSGSTGTLLFAQPFNLNHDVALSGNGIIDSSNNSVTINNTISGTGNLTKIGSGSLYLNPFANTYTGDTFVNTGTLIIGSDAALGVGGALTLGVDGVSSAVLQINGGVTSTRNVIIAEDSTISVSFGFNTALFNGVVSGTGKITKQGPGTLALGGNNSFSGGIDLVTGTLSLLSDNAAGTGPITTFGSVINYGNGVTIATPIVINSNTTQLQVLTGLATQNGNISELSGPRPLEKIGAGQLNIGGSNSFTGTFSISAGAVGVNSTTALGLGNVAMANGTTVQAIQSLVLQNNFSLTGNDTFDTQGFGLLLNGAISGAGSIVKIGSGSLQLYGNNNAYTGPTALNAGRIGVNTNAALGTGVLTMQAGTRLFPISSGLTLANQIVLNGVDEISSGPGIFTLTGQISGTGTLSKVNSGTLVLANNNNTHAGGTTINDGTLAVFSDGALGAPVTGPLTFEGTGTSTLQMLANVNVFRPVVLNAGGIIDTQGFDGSVSGGFISGVGSLTKIGTGRLTLNGTDSYAGGTFLNQGTLRIESGGGLGSGALTTTGGTTFVTGTFNNANIMLPNAIVLGAGTTTLDIVGTSSVQVYATDTYTSNGTTLGLNGAISGTGALNVVGTGKVTFANNNSYSGGTTVDQALIQVTNGNSLGTGALTLNGFSGLRNNSGGAVTLANTVTFNGGTNTVGGSSNLTLSGTVDGAADLVKVGADTVNLTGNASGFTGDTDIVNGKLLINTVFGAGGGQSVNVLTGATLGGAGVITANVNVGGFAHYAPGNSPGTMIIIGDLSFANNAIIDYDLGQASVIGGMYNDQTTVFGNLSFGANSTLNVTDSFAFGLGVYNLFTYTGTLTGTGPNTVNLPGGFSGFVQAAVPGFVNLIVGMPGALVQYWDGADMVGNGVIDGGTGTWNNTNTNWTTNAPSVLNATWQGGIGVFQGVAGTVNLTANESFQGLQFSTTGYAITATGAGGLTANGATFIATDPGVTATISAPIGGAGSILKQNSGTLVLNGANTYTGGTTVSAGTLQVGNNAALGTGLLTLQNGTTLAAGAPGLIIANAVQTNGVGTVNSGPGVFTLGGTIGGAGSIAKTGAGNLVLNGNNSFNGLDIVTGTVTVGTDTAAGSGLVTIEGGSTLAAGVSGLALANAVQTNGIGTVNSGPGVFTLNGTISGAGSILKSGSGNLVLNGANSYNGLDITNGTVTVGTNTAGGIGNINIGGGTTLAAGASGLVLANTISTPAVGTVDSGPGVFTLNGVISGAGSIRKTSTGNLVLNGANSYNGLDIVGGTVTVGTNTAGGIGNINIGDGTILAAGVSGLVLANTITTPGSGRVDSGPGVMTLNGVISGAGSISKIGSGDLALNGNNSFVNLGINQGTVTVGTNTAAGIGSIAINDQAILRAGVNGLVLTNNIQSTGSGRIDTQAFTFELDGSIGGPGSISKLGSGNLLLKGNNNFVNLGINQGTVTVFTNTAAGIGSIAINDGTILAAGVSGLVLANNIQSTGSGRINSGPGVFTLNGQIGGPGSISQIGTGNLVLNGNNNFVNLGINQGTVTVGTNTAAGVGSIAINDLAILRAGVDGLALANSIQSTGSGRVDTQAFTFELDGQIGGPGSISKIGSGNLLLKGNNSFVNLGINQGTVTVFTNTAAGIGAIAINDQAILAAGADGLVLANNIQTTGSGRVDTKAFTFELDGQIGGPGSISKVGSGNLLLKGNNSFVNLGINQGTVTVFTNTAAGVGAIAINDQAILAAGVSGLALANNIQTTGSGRINSGPGVFTLNGQIAGPGSISQIGTGNLVLNGNNSFVNLGINQGTVTVGTNTAAGIGGIAINDGAILAAGVSGLVLANNIVTTGGGRVNSGPGVFTLNGQIGGAGSISQIGTGNLILNGNNNFAGGLGINLGTVTLGTNTAAGTGTITINDGTILAAGANGLVVANHVETTGGGRVNSGPGIFTLSGSIGGLGSISQIGTGNLVLNGNNSFAGGLGINLGKVTLGTNTAAGTGVITINDGTILAAGVSGLVVANGVQTTGSGRVDSGPGTFTLSGTIGGLGSISQIGTGNLILNGNNNFAAGLGINQGTATLGTNTAAGTGTITINNGAILAAGVSGLVVANHVETTGGGRVDSGPGIFTLSGTIGGVGSISQIGTGNLVLSGANSFAGGLGINLGTATLGTNTAAGTGTITINDGAILAAGVSGLVVANAVETTGGGRVNSGPGVFTLGGTIGGLGSISQIGTGNLVLNGNNSFAGGLGINLGTATLGTNTAAGTGAITINDGAILAAGVSGLTVANHVETTGGGRVDSGPGVFRLNGSIGGAGSISQIGTGTLVLNGNNSFAGGLGINQGTVEVGTNTAAGTGAITINGGATLFGDAGVVLANHVETTGNGLIKTGTAPFTLNGTIGGAGSLTYLGAGILILNGANNFAGGLQINNGQVTLGTNTAAGSGTLTINDGGILAAGVSGLSVANAVQTTGGGRVDSGAGTFTLTGVIGGAGSISQIGTGNLILNAANTFAAGLGINQGTVTLGTNTSAGTGTITINNGGILAAGVPGLTLANGVQTTGGGRVNSGPGTLTLNGVIGGAGSISQIGTGNLVLNGTNTYAGGLGVNIGTVTLGSNTAAGTGTIALNAATLAAGVTGLTVANNVQSTGGGRIDSGTGTFTLSGQFQNSGGFTKVGTGNLILTGASSGFTGGVAAAAGRLTVNGALGSAVTVQTGATLAGGGSIGSLTAQSGGTVSPGAPEGTVGTLTVTGNASFASGSTYLVTVSGTTSDRIAVGGTASLGGANLSVTGGAAPAVFGTTYTVLTATGGRTGTFTPVFSGFGQAFNPTIVYGANDVRLTLAPASIAGLLGSGANGSQNIANFAGAFDASVAAGFNPQAFLPIFLQSGAALGASLNSLTGEITSANSRTAIADTRYIRDAALERLEAQLGDGGNGRGDQVATMGDGDHSIAFWVQGVGAWTDSDSDGNGAKLNIDAKGVVTGIDASFGEWKVGGLFNYIDSKVDTTALGRGKVASTGGALYGGYRGDSGFAFGAGGAVSHVSSKETRNVVAPIAQALRSKTSGTVYQAFGEISYDLAAAANTRVEPFLRAAYVSYHVDAINEAGGFAALNVAKGKYDSTVITGGLRGSVLLGGSAWLKGSAGYQYTTGDRSPVSLVSLAGTSGQAAIRAVPLDKSAFAGSLGIDFRITPTITLGAGYNGVIGKNTQDHGARATLSIGF